MICSRIRCRWATPPRSASPGARPRKGAGTWGALMAALAVDPYVTVDQARRLAGSTLVVDEAMEAGSIEQTPLGLRACTPAAALAAWKLPPSAVRRRVHEVLADGPDAWCAPLHRSLAGDDTSQAQAFAAAAECHRLGPPGHVAMALDAVRLVAAGIRCPAGAAVDGRTATWPRSVGSWRRQPAGKRSPTTELDGLRSRLAVISGHVRDPARRTPPQPTGRVRSGAVGADCAGNGAIADPPRGSRGRPAPARRSGSRTGRLIVGVAGTGALRPGGAGLPAARGVVTHRAHPGRRGLAVEHTGAMTTRSACRSWSSTCWRREIRRSPGRS